MGAARVRSNRRWIGRWIMGVGVVHVAFGLFVFADPLLAIVREGMWNAVDGHAGRPLAFWFVFLGFFAIIFGALVDWMEGRGVVVPARVSWPFFILVLVAIVTMPLGAGWLLLPPAVGNLMRSPGRSN